MNINTSKRLVLVLGLSVWLPRLDVNAEFAGYYAIQNPGPSGYNSIGSEWNETATFHGNWAFESDLRGFVEFWRMPASSAEFADLFILRVNPGGESPSLGMFTISQPFCSDPTTVPVSYSFRYSFGMPVAGNEAFYIDFDGVQKPLVGEGTATFKAPSGVDGEKWGFYVRVGSDRAACLVVRDWEPVSVPVPFVLSEPIWRTNGSFQFKLSGAPGSAYVTYASPDLTNWSPIASSSLPESGTTTFVDSSATNEVRRFYTVKVK